MQPASISKRNFVVCDSFDMELQRQALAAQLVELETKLTFVESWIDSNSGTGTGTSHISAMDVGKDDTLKVSQDLKPKKKYQNGIKNKTEYLNEIVEAEPVAPLAPKKSIPNLFQIGFELEKEASKTEAERQAAMALASQVSLMSRQRRQSLEATRRALEANGTLSPESEKDGSDVELPTGWEEGAEELEAATNQSSYRLSALERARSALLEMQFELDDIERRVKEASNKKWQAAKAIALLLLVVAEHDYLWKFYVTNILVDKNIPFRTVLKLLESLRCDVGAGVAERHEKLTGII